MDHGAAESTLMPVVGNLGLGGLLGAAGGLAAKKGDTVLGCLLVSHNPSVGRVAAVVVGAQVGQTERGCFGSPTH